MEKIADKNSTNNIEPPEKGRLNEYEAPVYGALNFGASIGGNAVELLLNGVKWAVYPCSEEGKSLPFEVVSADMEGEYSLMKGEGFSLCVVRYSSTAVALKLASNGSPISVAIACENCKIFQDKETEKKFTERQTIVLTPNRSPNEAVRATFYGGAESFSMGEGGLAVSFKKSEEEVSVYAFIGSLCSLGLKEISEREVKRAIDYYALKQVTDKLVCTGLPFLPDKVIAKALSHKCYDEHICDYAYFPSYNQTSDNMMIGAIVGLFLGDKPLKQITAYMSGDSLSALCTWIAFIKTRNHAFLSECYQKLNEDTSDFLTLDIMERASRVLGLKEDNARISAKLKKVENVHDYSWDAPLGALYSYFELRRTGDDVELEKLIKKCAEKSIGKTFEELIYPLIVLCGYFDNEYFMDDICPSVCFGKLLGGDLIIRNADIYGKKADIVLSKDVSSLTIGKEKVMEIVGGRAIIRNLKDETGGCSFFIKATKPLTIYLNLPIFGGYGLERACFSFKVAKGVSRVSIVNHRLTIKKE